MYNVNIKLRKIVHLFLGINYNIWFKNLKYFSQSTDILY